MSLYAPLLLALSFSSWWLPPNHSVHGRQVDALFTWIFAITGAVTVGVFVTMVWFMIRYRSRPGAGKARFTHGNTRLEMIWTLIPAIILGLISLASKQVWSSYRFDQENRPKDVKPATVMVIGQQFKWNILYPGPDGQFGQYLMFPKPTDAKWPDGSTFMGYKSPRDIPPGQGPQVINAYIAQVNPLGKNFDDPKGKDDIWDKVPGRALEVPLDRPVDIRVTSKDVIHSFALPDFRVKLDTVPGMLGVISFTATGENTLSSKRQEDSLREYSLDEIRELQKNIATRELYVHIGEDTPGADKDATGWRYSAPNPRSKTSRISIIRDRGLLNYAPDDEKRDTVSRLRAIGVTRIKAARPGYYDILCMELCGQGHYTMLGQMNVITNEEYVKKYETPGGAPAPTGH